MAHHEVVDLLDGACGGVLNGHYAVLAQAVFNGGEHAAEVLEVQNGGHFDHFLRGDLGVGALHAADGHRGILGEQLGGFLDGRLDFPAQVRVLGHELALVGAAQLEQGRIEHGGVVPHLGGHLGADIVELGPLPSRVQHRQALLLLVLGNAAGHSHPPGEQLHQLVVDLVNLLAIIL